MAEVSQVRTVNAAWFKSNRRRPSRQQPQEAETSQQEDSNDESLPSSLEDSDSPPHIDEYA